MVVESPDPKRYLITSSLALQERGLGLFAIQHGVGRFPSRRHSRVFSLLFHRHHHAAPFVVCERPSPAASTASLLPSGSLGMIRCKFPFGAHQASAFTFHRGPSSPSLPGTQRTPNFRGGCWPSSRSGTRKCLASLMIILKSTSSSLRLRLSASCFGVVKAGAVVRCIFIVYRPGVLL